MRVHSLRTCFISTERTTLVAGGDLIFPSDPGTIFEVGAFAGDAIVAVTDHFFGVWSLRTCFLTIVDAKVGNESVPIPLLRLMLLCSICKLNVLDTEIQCDEECAFARSLSFLQSQPSRRVKVFSSLSPL